LPNRHEPGGMPGGRRQWERPDMAGKRRRRPNWDDVDRGVKLALRIASEVVRMIIEAHGGHL